MSEQALLFAAAQQSMLRFTALAQTVLDPDKPYKRTWINQAVHVALKQLDDGPTRRLLLNVPNGFFNRLLVSTGRIAWKLGHQPNLRFLLILPNDRDYLQPDELAGELSTVFRDRFYRTLFPRVEVHELGHHEFGVGDSGRVFVTRALERLPTYPVDHIISIDADNQNWNLAKRPEPSEQAIWLVEQAFECIKPDADNQASIIVLNRRKTPADISVMLRSGTYGDWTHLEMHYHAKGEKAYHVRSGGDPNDPRRYYVTSDGEPWPEDPEGYVPGNELEIHNMGLHSVLLSDEVDMSEFWIGEAEDTSQWAPITMRTT